MNDLWEYIKANLKDEDFIKLCCGMSHIHVQVDGLIYSPTPEGLIKGASDGIVKPVRVRDIQNLFVKFGEEAEEASKPAPSPVQSPPANSPTPNVPEPAASEEEEEEEEEDVPATGLPNGLVTITDEDMEDGEETNKEADSDESSEEEDS